MSLDILGKLACAPDESEAIWKRLLEISAACGLDLTNDVDMEDKMSWEHMSGTCVLGLWFSADGTNLWNEAHTRAMALMNAPGMRIRFQKGVEEGLALPAGFVDDMSETRLGMWLRRIMRVPHTASGGVALVDGGMESCFFGSRDECLLRLLRSTVLPWDCSPNTLYIWGDVQR